MVDNRGPQLAGISAMLGGMALITVLLRSYVRSRMVKAFGLDDGFMVIALLTYIWYTASVLGGIHYGTGRHMATLTADDTMSALRFWWMCYVSYCATMTLAKISIGLFLLRVTVSRIHRYIIWTVLTITVITGLIFLFVTLFQCTPVEFFWTKVFPDRAGSCIDIEVIITLTYIYGSICAVCDFTFGLLPIFVVYNLNMDRRTKIMLVPILGMACIASCAVIIRMPFIKDFKNPDFLYATVDIAIWSTTEAGLAITAGSLATLRPLYRRLVHQVSTHEGTDRSFGHAPTPKPQLNTIGSGGPGRKARGSVFSTRNLTGGKDTRDDFDFELGQKCENKEAWLEDGDSGHGSASVQGSSSASPKKKDSWRIHVQEEFRLEDNRSDEIRLTALPERRVQQ